LEKGERDIYVSERTAGKVGRTKLAKNRKNEKKMP
jgi:hypothetical protein